MGCKETHHANSCTPDTTCGVAVGFRVVEAASCAVRGITENGTATGHTVRWEMIGQVQSM